MLAPGMGARPGSSRPTDSTELSHLVQMSLSAKPMESWGPRRCQEPQLSSLEFSHALDPKPPPMLIPTLNGRCLAKALVVSLRSTTKNCSQTSCSRTTWGAFCKFQGFTPDSLSEKSSGGKPKKLCTFICPKPTASHALEVNKIK